ncbi:anaphase-promoting complex component apc8 [Pleodorina starrii]|uniref:Anaphase-promoting complex component apc8 n=1 Tax=Pleodorina starrii TaxID=330485 RepID=A0A9W6BJ24_9CHLO|nr:anaphase-promoting complex component apc8 [Pleodorina starrii]GLC53102.1 anaphase-promoting complex component apc8 [Pleodorina starrii]GLC69255.1 anaphase-promoting complex component apc8 [Pleodorina starrii]
MVPERPGATVPSPATPADIAAELTQAIHDLNARGLFQAAQWAAEQLVGLELHSAPHPGASAWQHHHPHHHQQQHPRDGHAAAAGRGSSFPQLPRTDPDEQHPQYLLARAYFQAKEYRRSAHALAGLVGPLPAFLRLYATYLAGEKRREEERVEKGGPMGRGSDALNPELDALETALTAELGLTEAAAAAGGGGGAAAAAAAGDGGAQQQDPFLLYLYGIVLSGRGRTMEALDALVLSLRAYPCNWSAWMAVQSICSGAAGSLTGAGPATAAAAATGPGGLPAPAPSHLSPASASPSASPSPSPGPLPLPPDLPVHWVREFFLAAVSLSCQHNQEALSRLQGLAQVFRGSLAVEAAVAQAHYNLQNFDEAQALYEDLLARDPFRLEGTDTFSNILFVKEAAAPLSVLAHRVAATDKYRPETCCVLGNYYSLQGAHEKAVEYFRRALRLDPRYLAAWTLMGHEYMEVKNTPAAIDAYRRAIDVSPQDFRAWYGLGQAYELLKMPYYALYYYRRAAQLRPTDARMWCALAQCYEHEQAKLYESRGEPHAAERLFRDSLQRLEAQGPAALHSQDAIEALSFLAVHCKDTGRLEEAEELCARLMDVGGPAKERAKALAREIRSLQQFGGPPGAGAGAGAGAAAGPGPGSVAMDAEGAFEGGRAGVSPSSAMGAGGGGGFGARSSQQPVGRPGGRGSIFTAAAGAAAGPGRGGGASSLSGLGGLGGLGLGIGLDGLEGGLGLCPGDDIEGELEGCDPLAVLAVMQQLQFDRSMAVAALHRSGGDPVAAVRGYWYPEAAGGAAGGEGTEAADGG